MPSVNSLLEIARRGLSASQIGINTTGHNITNAEVEGYSRQRVNLQTNSPLYYSGYAIGTGVDVDGITRIRDQFLDKQINLQKQSLGYFQALETKYNQLESIYGEPSDTGLASSLNSFFSSWQDLANDPDSLDSRNLVYQSGYALSNKFNSLHFKLTDLQDSLEPDFDETVIQFNSYTRQLGEINVQLTAVGQASSQAGDLLDARDQLLQDISEIADVNIQKNQYGQVMLSLGGKMFLERDHVVELELPADSSDFSDVQWADTHNTAKISNGKLHGLIEMHDNVLGDQLEKLDNLALGLVSSINTLHNSGYGIDGSTNLNFFDGDTTGAKDIKLDVNMENDVRKIATSADGTGGNGDIALQISQLQDERVLANYQNTFSEYYSGIVSENATRLLEVQTNVEGQEIFVSQLEEQQAAVASVSQDEEMTNLIKFQQSYQAAAKLVTLAEEMMQTVLGLI